MTGLFASKEEKRERKELEDKVRKLLKKFELGDMQQLCQNTLGKEPDWHTKGEPYEASKGKWNQGYEPPKRWEFEDFIWKHVKKTELSYEQIQDYAVRHSLIPRNYFPDRVDLDSSSNTRRGFSESVKDAVLERQGGRCANCGKHSASFQFDHKDGNHSNNTPNNCQALCPNCHDIKSRGLN